MPPVFMVELISAVSTYPGQTGRFYKRILRENGFPLITRYEVNSTLYHSPDIFVRTMNGHTPSWFLLNDNRINEVDGDVGELVLDDLKRAIFVTPGLTGRRYTRILRNNGYPWISKRDVNRALYGNREIFWCEVTNEIPAWFLHDEYEDEQLFLDEIENAPDEEIDLGIDLSDGYEDDEEDFDDDESDEDYEPAYDYDDDVEWSNDIGLYDWQIRALNAWRDNKYRGVIEAVTGAGKTHVALAAIEAHLNEGWKVVVLVPSIALQNQWFKKIENIVNRELCNDYKIARLGGNNQTAPRWDILIAVANSAARHQLLPVGAKGLLIVDECHRFGADTWSIGLERGFSRRLGLTATLERSDNGLERILMPYFEERCYQLEYEEALDDGVIAHFKIAFIGVDFDDDEAELYEEADEKCRRMRNKLINTHGVSSEPFGEFMKEVTRLSNGGWGEATFDARRYIKAFSDRRKVISAAKQKIECLKDLIPSIKQSERTIIFTQTQHAAKKAVESLVGRGINAKTLDATMTLDERQKVFAGFENGDEEVVAAPMLLDEGVDVPSADLAIILASSKSRRQMIQRMGRVLRKKEDERLARVAILYVKDTAEDPELGAHGTFIDLIEDVAEEIEIFDALEEEDAICDYLNGMAWGRNFQ